MKNKPHALRYTLCIFLYGIMLMTSVGFCAENDAAVKPAGESVAPVAAKTSTGPGEQAGATESVAKSDAITLDFKEADIRNILKIIAYKSGVNIVATPEVVGNVTITLMEIPWEKALDTIVKTYGFGYEWLNSKVIMVSTLEKLAAQRKTQQEASENEPIDTETFVLNYTKAEDIRPVIEKLLSKRGSITVETRSNILIVTEIKTNLKKISEVIKRIDTITPQVLIECKIIETTLGSSEKLGIDWNVNVGLSGSKRPTTFPFTDEYNGMGKKMFPKTTAPSELEKVTTITYDQAGNALSSTDEKTWHKLVPGFPDVPSTQFIFGTLDFSKFQMVLEMLKGRSNTKIVSNPRITTLNNQEAKMFVGKTIPLATYSYSKETGTPIISGYIDKEVGIRLIVTPNINSNEYISLYIQPNIDEISGYTPSGDRPIIASRTAETRVMIKDGHTLVIGGLIFENSNKLKKGIPILGKIPILDLIFGNKTDTLDKTELLIFVTPHILKGDEFTQEQVAKLEQEMGQDKSAKKEKLVKKEAAAKKKKR